MRIEQYDWEEVVYEGKAKILIPRRELFLREDGVYEPAWSPVFYNPQAVIGRDVTTLTLHLWFKNKDFFFVDLLAGTGVRGIRIALETNGYGILNDVDPIAYKYCVRNVELNMIGDKLDVFMDEANSLMNSFTFSGIPIDYIDVDPYGSPIPFIEPVFKPLAKKALLGVSATDTASLTCSYKKKTLYRYNVECIETDFDKELGLRILLYSITHRGASLCVAVKPLISIYYKHYYRIIFETTRSCIESYRIISSCRGYLWFCPKSLERGFIKNPEEAYDINCMDNEKPRIAGPLWICSLGNENLVQKAYEEASGLEYISKTTRKILETLIYEYSINNPYIRLDQLYSKYRRNMIPIKEFIETLRNNGFKASRTHMDPRGIKTNATIRNLEELFNLKN